MKIKGTLVVTSLLVMTFPVTVESVDRTKTVQVDCGRGQTIGQALERGDQRKPMLVIVQGTCNENVQVDRNDVTLQGDPATGGAVNGPDSSLDTIFVTGNRVTIDGLTVTGGRNGVMAFASGGLTALNCEVHGAAVSGVVFFQAASGTVDGCSVHDNPRDGISVDAASATVINSTVSQNGRVGVRVGTGGSARIGVTNTGAPAGNTISNNGSNGIHVAIGSTAFIAMNQITGNGTDPAASLGRFGVNVVQATADVIGGNTISGNAGTGVNVRSAGVLIGDPTFGFTTVNTITGNGNVATPGGVFGFLGASLLIRNAVISSNNGFGLGLSLKSEGQLIASTIQNNVAAGPNVGDGIRLVFGSGLFNSAPPTAVTGNAGFGLQCTDGESSVVGTGLLVLGPPLNALGGVSGSCTGF